MSNQAGGRSVSASLPQKNTIMNEKKTIERLQYRIDRYRAMGNGAMCQDLKFQLSQLMAENK